MFKKINNQKVLFFVCLLGSLIFTTIAFQNFTVKKESLGELRTDSDESISILRSALVASDVDHEQSQMALNNDEREKKKKKGQRSVDSVEIDATIQVDEFVEPSEDSESEY